VNRSFNNERKDPLTTKIQEFPHGLASLLVSNAVFTLVAYFAAHGESLASIIAVLPGV
jgi:hypothetical protein